MIPELHLRRQRGVVAVEAVLMLPLLLLILWLSNNILIVMQQQTRLNRTTAALADTLANQPIPQGQRLLQRLASEQHIWLPLFTDMLRDGDPLHSGELSPGLVVTYLDSTTLSDRNGPAVQRHASGTVCPPADKPSLAQLARDGLATPLNVARSELILVESCWPLSPHPSLPQWLLPRQLTSRFVALRRQWS
ncbi:hypothetical protein [Herbaspirillum sp. RV1423]|uniref:hypothetical protein n=1 Tax=Herbaspirillum sp. RV1423 TaxID=1443993 RepID=UPI000554C210|nr:hypothetical protein [Herbaspirillum sp. RV1423]